MSFVLEIGSADQIMGASSEIEIDAYIVFQSNEPSAATVANVTRVNGTPMVGTPLSITPGTFSGGYPIPTVASTIYANNVVVSTTGSYTPVTADIGKVFKADFVASNLYGDIHNVSDVSVACVAALAAATVVSNPVVNGTPTVGTPLSITPAVFSGANPAATVTRNIYANNIVVSTTNSYTPVTGDVNKVFKVEDIATNSVGSTSSMGANSAVCVPMPVAPTAGAAPTINATPQVNVPMSITAGTFTGAVPAATLSRVITANDVVVSTTGSYTPVQADLGKTFKVDDIATNSAGTAHNVSATSAACLAAFAAATVTSAPVINGTPQVNTPLSITAGTFSGANPAATITRVIYANGIQVSTGPTYTPITTDAGKIFTVDDVATNSQGATHNMSANSATCLAAVFRSIYTQDLGTNNQYEGRVAVRDSLRTSIILRNKNAYPIQYNVSTAANSNRANPYNMVTLPPGQEVYATGIDQWWVQPLTYTTEALTSSGKTATVTLTNHGFTTGQTIYMYAAGSTTDYRYGGVITVVDANTFTYQTTVADIAPGGTNGKFALYYLNVEVEIQGVL